MTKLHLMNILAAGVLVLPGVAAGAESDNTATVKVVSRKNPGDLHYDWAYGVQTMLNGWLPAEPRLTDFTLRVLFADLSPGQADEFMPDDWGVAIVGDTVDQTVKISRGGYFDLPDLPKAREEDATLMFHTQTTRRMIGVFWRLRSDGKSVSYQDFSKALDEVKGTQKKIPFYNFGSRFIKWAKVDALKACFDTERGAIEVEGAQPIVRGRCALLTYSPALLAANPTIRFSGALASLTLEESRNW